MSGLFGEYGVLAVGLRTGVAACRVWQGIRDTWYYPDEYDLHWEVCCGAAVRYNHTADLEAVLKCRYGCFICVGRQG